MIILIIFKGGLGTTTFVATIFSKYIHSQYHT